MSMPALGNEDDITILALDNPFSYSRSYYIPVCDSTMLVARRLSADSPYGLVRTGTQRAGRGRLPGRTWHALKDESLLVTMWFPASVFDGAPPPLVSGLALRRACTSWAASASVTFSKGLSLKWPNDLLCGERKMAGLLCEASGSTVYVGIGLNCLQDEFPTGFSTDPSSIYMETGKKPELNSMAAGLANAFHTILGSSTPWKDEYESAMAWRKRRVRFVPGIDLSPVQGVLIGVDDSGAVVLTLEGESIQRSFPSGELRRY